MIIENNDRKILIGKNFSEAPSPSVQNAELEQKELLYNIAKTIEEGGYNVTSQLMGFIISEDPAHISNYKNARTLIGKIDRDELITDMIRVYLESLESTYGSKEAD